MFSRGVNDALHIEENKGNRQISCERMQHGVFPKTTK